MKRRIFIAVNLPAETKKIIAGFIDRAKKANEGADIKWTAEDNLHMTLYFLGYLDENALEEAKKAAKKAAESCRQKSVSLKIGGVGGFPNLESPKVLFLSARGEGVDTLSALHKILAGELEKSGFETEKRPWKPHITLGRVKNHGKGIDIPENTPEGEKFRIGSIDIMESHLSSKGPKYGLVAKYPLRLITR